MPVGAAVSAPSRPISPVRGLRKSSPLNPLTRPSTSPFKSNNKIHLSNLERLLQRHSHPPPHPILPTTTTTTTTNNNSNNGLLNALNLGGLFQPFKSTAEELMSPRSLTHLQRLLSFDSPRPSPRNSIASIWRELHGSRDWAGLLDPLDENLRRELVRYGDLVQAAYHAFHSNPSLSPSRSRHVVLPDRSYRVTRNLFATSSIQPPRWVSGVAPWMTHRSSWIGYVAVCENEREIKRMGRRDIVIALRGTATCLEWAENFRAGLVPVDDDSTKNPAKVECGFWNLYKTAGSEVPSLSSSVVEEVRRLMEQYKGEELSITVTGHSLGAALAVLVGEELSQCAEKTPPVAVVSFGGPRVGNRGFADRVERRGVKVLRVVNAHDMVTRVPLAAPVVEGYADVGEELKVDSRVSPYLRRNADPACCHDLEAYLHLVDGFLGTHCPFRANAKRSLARLLSQQGPNVKKLYMAKAQAVKVDRRDSDGMVNFGICLPSPS